MNWLTVLDVAGGFAAGVVVAAGVGLLEPTLFTTKADAGNIGLSLQQKKQLVNALFPMLAAGYVLNGFHKWLTDDISYIGAVVGFACLCVKYPWLLTGRHE